MNSVKETVINARIIGDMSESQAKAFSLFKEGKNVLLMGAAGVGKSYCIKYFKEYAGYLNKRIWITATTGVAAFNIKGITIHSYLGWSTSESNVNILLSRSRRQTPLERIKNTDILVIDEVSMMSAEFLEKINYTLQKILNNKEFFGGIQVVFSCDPMQLLPVFNSYQDKNPDTRLFVESPLINIFFHCVLKENFRQKNSGIFRDILDRVRFGEYTGEDIAILKNRLIVNCKDFKDNVIKLVSTNKKASFINQKKLNECIGEEKIFKAVFLNKGDNIDDRKLLDHELRTQFDNRGLSELKLKVNSRVMLLRNIDVNSGLVNGSTGVIEKFINGYPYVKFDSGAHELIEPFEWEIETGGAKAIAVQIPLTLGYALTIHKSQSQTLHSAILDLKDCFCDAQVYVALSRVASLDNMYLQSFDENKIKVNETMKNFYKKNLDLSSESPENL